MRKITLALLALMTGMLAMAQEAMLMDRSSLDEPPTGYVNGLFTVNEGGTQVYFSQGNLQYVGGEWRFAEHQWDILGDNGQGSASEDASRDLFGWGTSGRAHGALSYQPWSTSQTDSEYYAYGDKGYDLVDEDGTADWGSNGIANGGDVEGLWRVLTREEWEYLFFGRATSSGIRYAKAKVNGVKGVLVLPDDWSEEYRALNNTNAPGGRYRDNVITLSDWESTMEPHGAVFLPAGGYRFETKVWHSGERGSYYSATSSGSYHAWNMSFDDANLYSGTSVTRRGNGMSVRLVSTSTSLWYTSVTTGEVTEITPNSATASGTVVTEGGTVLTAVGVCWSTSTDPTVEGEHTDEGVLTGDFTSALTGLERNTTYYVRAYATDGEGDTMYGDVVEFTTLAELPAVTTSTINDADIDITTAMVGGEVTDDGGTTVDECGVCWGATAELTIEGDHVAAAVPGVGTFTVALTGLTQNTTYYVRAYATNVVGTVYGDAVSFTTLRQPWDVTATAEPAEGGTVTGAGTYYQDDECTLTATANEGYAFVNWTEGVDETGTPNVVSTDATYTLEVTSAHTLVAHFELDRPQGTINGKFSVNATGDQVYFSQGNLQYQASTNTWQFAEHQWDYVGGANANASANSSGWMDLFGWGTSGYNHGAVCYQPWSTSTTNSDYYAYGSGSYNLFDQTGKADWGYNAISNGGNKENDGWRTLTQEEWDYLFNTRNPNGTRYAKANVNGVNGVILLPDDWREDYYSLSDPNTSSANYNVNTISLVDWAILELYGAVFLPAAGCRVETLVNFSGSHGHYWSASSNANSAYIVRFVEDNLNIPNNYYKSAGRSVRLVRSIYSFTISASANPLEGGEVSGAGTYDSGESCTLTATPAEGYTFVNWTEEDKVVSTDATYTFEVTASRTLVANFELAPTSPEGALNGKFSVNADGDQVYFSQGNLQYIGSAATPYWKFAEHQWDYLGTTTNQNSQNQNVDRDLFGWGTSGYDHGANGYQPWSTSTTDSDYYAYGNENYNLNDETGQADWGYNAIINGGNEENQWFTLSREEWDYVFNTRTTTSGIRYAKATVNEVNGVILLPDDWDASYYTLSNTNTPGASFSTNTISEMEWATLEQHGAVFLPAAGNRNGTSVGNVGSLGIYWSASYYYSDDVWLVFFFDSNLYTNNISSRYGGRSVRLVRDAH